MAVVVPTILAPLLLSIICPLASDADVAVATPVTLIPPAETLIPFLAVIRPTESILVTSS